MSKKTFEEQIALIKRATVDFINEEELLKKLNQGKPLTIKAGFDPTSPDLHLGHTVVMQKLKQFQDFGHRVVFVVGDFTARIGDPSGRNEARPHLTEKEIRENSKTYTDQAFKILEKKKTKVCFNSEWLGKMSAVDVVRLSAHATVARMLERDDFKKRYTAQSSISLHEFLYPLLQAQDSVELKADVELGGTDQIFNLLLGRELQRDAGQEPQIVITVPLLVGTDGVQKMSKSYGNSIGITDTPREMFGKVMSLSDDQMWEYYKLLSEKDFSMIERMKKEVQEGTLHPKQVKINLASEMVTRFHHQQSAADAHKEFERIFSQKKNPEEMLAISIQKETPLYKWLVEEGVVKSGSECRRLIAQGGIRVNEEKIKDAHLKLPSGEHVVQVGKRQFVRVNVSS